MNGRKRILQDVGQMMDELSDDASGTPGMLRIISSFGFGRRVVVASRRYQRWRRRIRNWNYVLLEDRLIAIWSMKVSISIFALAMTSALI